MDGQDGAVRQEFTHQAGSFGRAEVMRSAATLDALVSALPLRPDQRWVDVACGPGIVACALAPTVAEVIGVDLTPAMVAAARHAAADVPNLRFVEGDATALPIADGACDGAVTRFSLHHIPAPWRVIGEMARVVAPGGFVAAADHLTCADARGAAWHQEIERLRDPSHWCSLPPATFFGLGTEFGLRPVVRREDPFDMDWEEWLGRGSGGPGAAGLIRQLLARAPAAAHDVFGVRGGRLAMTLGIAVWQKL